MVDEHDETSPETPEQSVARTRVDRRAVTGEGESMPPSRSMAPTLPIPSEEALLSGELTLDDVLADEGFSARYHRGELLGVGGMGEVRLFHDHRIGRDVAIKVIQGDEVHAGQVVRFLREARVQGQLEHPSIVPVYDLGLDQNGDAYFSMKRLKGTTLHSILRSARKGGGLEQTGWSERKLLGAFNQVCLAVDYAHQHGVVHRDLKPANLMFGDFGEVYVLDWGLATMPGALPLPAESGEGSSGSTPRATRAGDLIGTPGYMAPEQARGDGDTAGPAADIYALGTILFEMLALEPIHGEEGVALRIASTVMGSADRSPASRTPGREIAPELDQIVLHATELAVEDRFGSARELSDAVEAYLDGMRDSDLREKLARDHRQAAEAAADEALALEDEQLAEAQRRKAMHEVGRALALTPEDPEPLRTMVRLLDSPPRRIPDEVRVTWHEMSDEKSRWAMGVARWIYLLWLLPAPFIFWAGVREPKSMAIGAIATLSTMLALHIGSRQRPLGAPIQYAAVIGSAIALGAGTRMFGPLMYIPAVTATAALSFAMTEKTGRRYIWTALCSMAVLGPYLLETAGLLSPSYAIRNGVLEVLPHMHAFPAGATVPYLLAASMLAVIVPAIVYGGILRGRLNEAERSMLTQKWHLERLLPPAASGPT
ncbi:MAG: protein kinase [Deltaproteobacteria bacterium]|nr:protein kinase [Deltaproteobacteria bacterium]